MKEKAIKVLRFAGRHWKKLLWAFLVVLSLCIFGLMNRADRRIVRELTAVQVEADWETEEKPYAMAAVYLSPTEGVSPEALPEIYLAVENALTAGGVPSEDHPWLYACAVTRQEVLQNGIASTTVELNIVAGDYFRLHPLPIRQGWYMDETEVMHDRIILDRQAAWDLFYSDNVAGQFCELGGQRYQVAAVVDTEPGTYNALAAGDTKRAWVFADSPGITEDVAFSGVEMLLPQPVKGFARSTLQSVLEGFVPLGTEALDITGRFSLPHRWEILKNLTTRGISNGFVYPYYENAAQLTENRLALRLVPEGLLLLFPAVSLLIVLLWLNSRRTWGLHSIPEAIDNAIDRRNTRNYEARNRAKETGMQEKSEKSEKTPRLRSIPLPKRRKKAGRGLNFSSKRYGQTKRR